MDKVNIADKFASFDTHWDPKVIGEIDDFEVKLVKLEGDFVWHKHDDEDEMFFVVEGKLEMAFRDRTVTLGPGEMIIVQGHRTQTQCGGGVPSHAFRTQGRDQHGRCRGKQTDPADA